MFFASYYEALQYLSDEQFGVMMRAICEFAIGGSEPDLTDPILKGYWVLIRPTLELSVKRATARKTNPEQNDNKTTSNRKQNTNKTETNPKQNNNKPKTKSEQTAIKTQSNLNQSENKSESNPNQNPIGIRNKDMDMDVGVEEKKEKETPAADYISELKNSQIWLEQMAMKFQLSLTEVVTRLDDFALDCECRAIYHQDLNDTRRHYNDWLRIQLDAERRKNYDSDRKKSEDRRKGSDVTATSAEDYEGAF